MRPSPAEMTAGHLAMPTHNRLLKPGFMAAGSLALVGVLGEGVLPAARWRDRRTEVRGEGGQWLAFGGLEEPDGDRVISELNGIFEAPIDSMKYSMRGITKASLGRALGDYYQKHYDPGRPTERQNIVAHSMGWPTALLAMQDCVEKGRYVPPLDTVVAISSPQDIDDICMPRAVETIVRSHYQGGFFSKLALDFLNTYRQEKFAVQALGRCVLSTPGRTWRSASPSLCVSQMRLLREARGLRPETFAGIITDETRMILCADPADSTVLTDRSLRHIAEFVEPMRARLIPVETPGAGHANVAGSRTRLAPLLAC